MTFANTLTILRILSVPVLVLLIRNGAWKAALLLFVAAGVSDFLDGWIARKWRQESQLGITLDPLADKFLLISVLLALSWLGVADSYRIPSWLTVTVIARDLLLVLGSAAVYWLRGMHVFPPSFWGKSATLFQVLSVFLVLFANTGVTNLMPLEPIFLGALALTLISGLHYLSRASHLSDFGS